MQLIPNYCQHPDYWNPGIHLLYVGDRYRLDPYLEAIRQVVRPGMVVADIGTGSGPLARFAAGAGASRVYGIEQYREILRYAERFNQTEGIGHVIELVHGDSRSISLEQPVDVIVAELIASLGNDEAMSGILEDARERFLKPGGTIIPSRVEVFMSPVSAPEAHAEIPSVYEDDLIVEPRKGFSPFGIYYQIFGLPPERLLAAERLLDTIDLMHHTPLSYERQLRFNCRDKGTFSGFAGWFKAALTDHVMLDTSPQAPQTCWGQAFFAVREQLAVQKGDTIELTFSAEVPHGSDRPFYRWGGVVKRGDRKVGGFSESSAASHMLCGVAKVANAR
jgi:protein arginine N-methyltransferase 1